MMTEDIIEDIIKDANYYYRLHLNYCKRLEEISTRKLRDKGIKLEDIFCSFIAGDGLSFTFELDKSMPYTISVSLFFELVNKEDFKIGDLKKESY